VRSPAAVVGVARNNGVRRGGAVSATDAADGRPKEPNELMNDAVRRSVVTVDCRQRNVHSPTIANTRAHSGSCPMYLRQAG
jgi:hypothetical protein